MTNIYTYVRINRYGDIMKKGFTLAEILIVLMVIGVIAMMTVPSILLGATTASYKSGYKKAYQTIYNFAAAEKLAGQIPTNATGESIISLYNSLATQLSVTSYVDKAYGHDGNIPPQTAYYSDFKPITSLSTDTFTDWILSDDGFSYLAFAPNGGKCQTSFAISNSKNAQEAYNNSCAIIIVDVNGVAKTPNIIDTPVAEGITAQDSVKVLKGDQYYIYLGMDGASSGSKTTTVTGRIIANLE